MEASFFQRHPAAKDIFGIIIFIVCVFIGTILINTFIFRSFSVVGPSMENTLHTGDRLIIDRVPVTIAHIQGKDYIPQRGQIIVFKNPQWQPGSPDQYIVKRVIGLPGERVVLKNGVYTVYNATHPTGFNPDQFNNNEPGQPASGEVDETVPDNEIFVSGDHRQGDFSYDSRNGLGTIPSYDIVGPVSFRIYPFTQMRSFFNEGAPY
jgi:signal peptidase I